jgi:hypothetical protein
MFVVFPVSYIVPGKDPIEFTPPVLKLVRKDLICYGEEVTEQPEGSPARTVLVLNSGEPMVVDLEFGKVVSLLVP